jgi:hypothetical protein
LDYVSCTAKSGEPAERLIALGRGIVRDEQAAGNELRTADWKGYALIRSGQASLGIRRQDALVTVSGAAAFLFGHALLELATHASRADLQITMHSDEWKVRELIWRARYKPDFRQGRGRPIERHYVDNSRLGATCYIGSAKSDQRGRFYDKHAEKPEEYEPGTARLEVQYRNRAAEAVRLKAASGRLDSTAIRGTVGQWFKDRGALAGVKLPAGDPIKPPAREESDCETFRQWLRACVAPGIQRWRHVAPPRAFLDDLGLNPEGDYLDDEQDAEAEHEDADASRPAG